MAAELGPRLAHLHLADGSGVPNRDEHLVPGRGTQPCATMLHRLAAEDYQGLVVLEVKTFRAPTQEARLTDLAEALEFTRANLAAPGEAHAGAAPAGTSPARPVPAGPVPAGPVPAGPVPASPPPARFGVTARRLSTSR
jgi:hypothetical protein